MYNNITDVPGIKVGHAAVPGAQRGCTVVLTEAGAVASCEVRGAAPGTRETDLLEPTKLVEKIHAVVLTGGSAFGLAAADGVMTWLERHGIGYHMGDFVVPIVCGAVIFDLPMGQPQLRPTSETGMDACARAAAGAIPRGKVGAGLGATVGKLWGYEYAMPSGLGMASVASSGAVVGALGAVVDEAGRVLAGPYDAESGTFFDNQALLRAGKPLFAAPGNTTLAVVATDAQLTKTQARKVAEMAHNGLARSIYPVHTMYDGDTVFVLSTGAKPLDVSTLGTLAADVVAAAVRDAVQAAAER